MRFEDFVDLTCYVNLDRRPERKDFMEKQFEREQMVVHRIAGVDSEKPLPGKIDPVFNIDTEHNSEKDGVSGMIGCSYSMGLALSLAKISGAKSLLYFEDDAILCQNFKREFAACMTHAPDNYHVINFGGWKIEEPKYFNHHFGLSSFTLNAHCVLFNHTCYDIIIEALKLQTAYSDFTLSSMKNLRYLVSHHFHINQSTGFSDTTYQDLDERHGRVDSSGENQSS